MKMIMRKIICHFDQFHWKNIDFFFIITGEKASTNNKLNKMYSKKNAKLTCLFGPMYLQLDDYPTNYDKQPDIFDTKINKT